LHFFLFPYFTNFFQVFLLTVIFGLWHGLFVMPVLLSIIGPLNGGGGGGGGGDHHGDKAVTTDTAAATLSNETKKGISTLGGTLTKRPSLTIKNSFVIGKLTGS
jgi:hypothetical protein